MTILTDQWGLIKERLKQKYPDLTDNDLAYIKDREEEILQRIAEKTGVNRAEVDEEVRAACAAPNPAPVSAAA